MARRSESGCRMKSKLKYLRMKMIYYYFQETVFKRHENFCSVLTLLITVFLLIHVRNKKQLNQSSVQHELADSKDDHYTHEKGR